MKKKESKKDNFLVNGIRKTTGIFLIILGIIGLFIPILQGFALIIAGIILLQNKYLLKQLKALRTYFKKRSKK